MQHIISLHTWVSLSSELRSRIRAQFNIPRSSHVVVNDGRIETDGTTPEDFKHLTVEKMQTFLNDKSDDLNYLFDKVVARIQDEIEGKLPEIIETNAKKNKKSK